MTHDRSSAARALLPRAAGPVALAFLVCGCPLPGPDRPLEDGGASSAEEATIGPEGGSLQIDGATLTVPAGALAEETTLRIEELEDTPVRLPEGRSPGSRIIALTPHGTTFQEPILLALVLDASAIANGETDLVSMRLAEETAAAWETIEQTTTGNEVEIKTSSFSFYTVTVPTPPESCILNLDPPDCESGFVDHDCDAEIGDCPEGQVLGLDPDRRCPACIPAPEDETCEEAAAELVEMLEHTVPGSCGNYCDTDSDCFLFRIESACDELCLSLHGGIDEETLWAVETYARDRCGACGSTTVEVDALGPEGACVQNQCVFPIAALDDAD